MVNRIFTQLDEEQALHWLGAAVVSLWQTVPHDLQESIVQRALAMSHGDEDAKAQIGHFTKAGKKE
jgi:hypothetical protein